MGYLMFGWARMVIETIETFLLEPPLPIKTVQEYERERLVEAARDFRYQLRQYEAKYGRAK